MTIERVEIDRRIKGGMNEDEQWWYLCLDTDTGEFFIEHQWDYVNRFNVSQADRGKERIEIEGYQGRGSDKIEAAKAELLERTGS